MELSLLSYNIHKGLSSRNKKFILSGIRSAIRDTGADVVFLQEVIGEHSAHKERFSDWPNQEQFEYLADSVWTHFAYGKNAVYDEGHHGNAVLSKYPITGHDNLDISGGQFEQRGILHCRLELPDLGRMIDCYCTHLGLFHSVRLYQFERICEWVQKTSVDRAPILIGGDFNDWRKKGCEILEAKLGVQEAHRVRFGRLALTFPSRLPVLALDRIYSRGFHVESARVLRGRPWSTLSDHAPLLVRLTLK